MKKTAIIVLLCLFTAASLAFGQEDREGTKDYPGITRMPGYYIDTYSDTQFDSVNMPVTKNGGRVDQQVEGRVIRINYYIKQNVPATSMLQVVRNYQNAARTAGGQVMDDNKGGNYYNTTLRLVKGGKEIWILVEARDDSHVLTVVEKQAMQQDIAMDAANMASGLAAEGRVSLYGIYFDTAKSDLKPESEPTLAEIAKLLKNSPALRLAVVGHTDMVGDLASNITLSQARAQSVIAALTGKYGIAASRLVAFGNGAYAPVASNKTDEGRGKNRRVELVDLATK